MSCLVDLETLLLQKLGPACVAAYNAYNMCIEMKSTKFLAMEARHCAGNEMSNLMAYGASVGSLKAKRKVGALGFIGSATDATAHRPSQSTGPLADCSGRHPSALQVPGRVGLSCGENVTALFDKLYTLIPSVQRWIPANDGRVCVFPTERPAREICPAG